MTALESNPVNVTAGRDVLFRFLSDIGNLKALMPPQVEDFQPTGEACTFRIKGMARIGLRLADRAPGRVSFESTGPSPFSFTLACRLEPAGDAATRVTWHMDADLSPMLRMMAATPLENLLNFLADRCRNQV